MDLINDLEKMFKNINAKLNDISKIELVSTNKKDLIIQRLAVEETRYKNELNECRMQFIKLVLDHRNQQLELVNNKFKIENNINLGKLKLLSLKAKDDYIGFIPGWLGVLETFLSRCKRVDYRSCNRLVKYDNIIKARFDVRMMELVRLAKMYDFNLFQCSVHTLSSQKTFFYSHFDDNMFVFNKSGVILHSKHCPRGNDVKVCDVVVYVNATNILCFDQLKSIAQIYNFKLDLVRSIEFDRVLAGRLVLNNFEIATTNEFNVYDHLTVTFYNYSTVFLNKSEIQIQKSNMDSKVVANGYPPQLFEFKLDYLDDRFLFFGVKFDKTREQSPNAVLLLNRKDDNNFFKIIYFDNQSISRNLLMLICKNQN